MQFYELVLVGFVCKQFIYVMSLQSAANWIRSVPASCVKPNEPSFHSASYNMIQDVILGTRRHNLV